MRNVLLMIICTLLTSCALDVYESNKEIMGFSDVNGTKPIILNPGTVWTPHRFITNPYRRIIVIDTSKLTRLPNAKESTIQRKDVLPVYLDKIEHKKLFKNRKLMILYNSHIRVNKSDQYFHFFEVGKKIN